MPRIIFFAVVTVVLIAFPNGPSIVAHPGVHPPSPPTYDYDTATPGTQPPTSPLLAGSTARIFETLTLTVSATVPLLDLQAIMPDGFNATALPSPPNPAGLAAIALRFRFQTRIEHLGQTFGPASGLSVFHVGRNNMANRNELLSLANVSSDAGVVDASNSFSGPGSTRLGDVQVEIDEKTEEADANGTQRQLRVKFEVEDETIGLDVKAEADGPAAINVRNHGDPFGFLLRPLTGTFANPAQRTATQGDVVTFAGNPRLLAEGGQLALPGGRLTILEIGNTVTFTRWFETFIRPE
jgi:hypothetical protein